MGWFDMVNGTRELASFTQGGGRPTHGQKFGTRVWDSATNSLIDAPNAGDPNQRGAWQTNELAETGNKAENQFNELVDPSSKYNKGLLDYFMKFARKMAPTENQLYGVNKASGVSGSSSAYLAQEQSKAAQGRATEMGSDAFSKQFLQNQGIAQGFLGMKMNADKAGLDYWLDKDKMSEEKKMRQNEMYASFLNSAAGLGGGLLGRAMMGGGGGSPAGGGGGGSNYGYGNEFGNP